MSTAFRYHELAREAAKPATASDLSDKERVERAKQAFIGGVTTGSAMYLETCIRCGMCSEACHFYLATQDAKYTPIVKLDLMRRVYRREVAPMGWLRKLFTRDITLAELEEWQELVFDSCTQCGRCSLLCPMGINIARMIGTARSGLAAAGLAPAELQSVADEQDRKGSVFGAGSAEMRAAVERVSANSGISIPLDKESADIMVLTSALDFLKDDRILAATAMIMNHLGLDWTIRSDGFEAANFGAMAGDRQAQKKITQRIVDAAEACNAKTLIVSECGHAYPVLRWEAANVIGRPLSFDVMAMSEFIGREIKAGRLQIRKLNGTKKVTLHDPCKVGRIGGALEESRDALDALGVDLVEMESHGRTNLCCGGGGGVVMLKRAEPLRKKALELKKTEIDGTGADTVITACSTCHYNLELGKEDGNWNVDIDNLVTIVGENLAQ